jgi:hypothetical protein
MSKFRSGGWRLWVAGTVALVAVAPASAQTAGGGATGGAGGSILGGSSSGGGVLGGSSSGGGAGGASPSGSFLGTTGGSFAGNPGGGLFVGTTTTGTTGSYTGTTTAGRAGGVSGSSGLAQVPTTQNSLQPFYANPLAQGQNLTTTQSLLNTTTTTSGTFGQPTLGTTKTTTTRRGAATTSTAGGTGLSTVGQVRSPAYMTVLGFTPPRPAPAQLQSTAAQVLARSSSLPSAGNIQVGTEGETVVLRGSVADDRERRLAENLLRLTPGIRQIRNELVVRPAAATP